jgi:hypothetical protein
MGDLYRLVGDRQISLHCHREAFLQIGDHIFPHLIGASKIARGENDLAQVWEKHKKVSKIQDAIPGILPRERIDPEGMSPYSLVCKLSHFGRCYPPGDM